jgi:hypothetical protein
MDSFIARFGKKITGTLSGFDRLVFRGTLLPLVRDGGMSSFLKKAGVRLLDFKEYVAKTSEAVKAASLAEAERHERPVRYLESSATSKEDLAKTLLAEHPVRSGLVCAFKTVEPCRSFEYHRDADRSRRGLKLRTRKCLHIYKYFIHPLFGFMNARIQTWFPFNIQVCINGREWLARELGRRGAHFKRYDNCLTWVRDVERAQAILDEQLKTPWATVLDYVAAKLNPLHDSIFAPDPQTYYWSAHQSEWATDLLFEDPQALAAIYPAFVRHAMANFASPDVMRFLGRKAHGCFTGEIVTSFKNRPEGVRVKHWVDGNSIKMYDKAGSVLRIETTIGNPAPFKVFRPHHADPHGPLSWRPLRKGVADLQRRAVVSQSANDAYLDALSTVADDKPVADIFDAVSRRVSRDGRHFRALRIGAADDLALLKAISRGEFITSGFRNRDLQRLLYPVRSDPSPEAARRISARVSRLLRLLRAHGLVRKIPKSHRYAITPKGRLLATALFATRQATPQQLAKIAA